MIAPLDFIEPLEESWISWLLRMLKFCSVDDRINIHALKTMTMLFGGTFRFPGLYLQKGLNHFIKQINRPDSKYFLSVDAVLCHMTLFPLYAAFMKESVVDKVLRYWLFTVYNSKRQNVLLSTKLTPLDC